MLAFVVFVSNVQKSDLATSAIPNNLHQYFNVSQRFFVYFIGIYMGS